MISRFGKEDFAEHCRTLAAKDKDLASILDHYGLPPCWTRPPGFATLVHILLEQQVSLASALAALTMLKKKLGSVNPEKLMRLSDQELKSCYFSRQKIGYAREISRAILNKELDLKRLGGEEDPRVRETLTRIKGIGDWTVDIYLIMALRRADIFPSRDLALLKSLKKIKQLPESLPEKEILRIADSWRPYRSVATMMLWHHYLSEKRNSRKPGGKTAALTTPR
jgi:DNA-3-methyladenine glycosylase II